MHLNSLFPYYELLKDDQLSLVYQGVFSDELTEKILQLNEKGISASSKMGKIKNKVAFLLAECFQNIVRHEDKPEILNNTNNKPGMFMVRHVGSSYYVTSVNRIANNKVDGLKQKLHYLESLSLEELKKESLKQLANEEVSDKGGAGLGLLVMALKTNKQIQYDFEFLNYFLSLFFLQTKIDHPENMDDSYRPGLSLNDTKKLHHQMSEQGVILINKGDFSQETVLPLLAMIEKNLALGERSMGYLKKLFYVLIEMLQNVSKHGEMHNGIREGLLLLAKKRQHYMVYAGNIIANSKIENLKRHLDEIIAMDKDALTDLYKKRLKHGEIGYKGGAGLGLIDICRYSSEKFSYEFSAIDKDHSFVSFCAIV
jgi:hypothetical protein